MNIVGDTACIVVLADVIGWNKFYFPFFAHVMSRCRPKFSYFPYKNVNVSEKLLCVCVLVQ